jgi:hypothetical protein
VRLSEIGRALEEPVALAKTETRLSRNLARPGLRRRIGQAVPAEGASTGERHLLSGQTKAAAAELAASWPMQYATHILREEKGREISCRLDYGFRQVAPARPCRDPLMARGGAKASATSR